MSRVRADQYTNNAGTGSPLFTHGVRVTGVATATTFDGNLTGDATGLAGTPNLNVGVITATKFDGDGSSLGPTIVASGTISNGDTIIINTDGTVSAVSGTGSPNMTVGITSVFEESDSTTRFAGAYDSTNQKVVIAYKDVGDSSKGKAVVGTVSGNDITFGTPVEFVASTAEWISATYDSTNSRVIIAYQQTSPSSHGYVRVGQVSGTSISFGTAVQFETSGTDFTEVVHDSSNDRIVVFYKDYGGTTNTGFARVGTVDASTNGISFPSAAVQFTLATRADFSATFDSTNNKVVLAYVGSGAVGKARVGTVSLNTISFGTEVDFEPSAVQYVSTTFDSSNNKVVIAYQDETNNDYGTAIVGTVSGTDISFGDASVFASTGSLHITIAFNSSTNKVVIVYSDNNDNNRTRAVEGEVSGTDISFENSISVNIDAMGFLSSGNNYLTTIYDSNNNKIVVPYTDTNNSNYGTVFLLSPSNLVTNLTAENYIGIAAEAITNGASGKITTTGGINESQTGLTVARTYYVNPTGGISLTNIKPSVLAGTSVSATNIIVNGTLSKDTFPTTTSTVSQSSGTSGSTNLSVLTTNTNLENGKTYMLNASGLVLTLPTSPDAGDAIDILNNVTGIHTVARNGSTIQSLSEDMEVNTQGIQFKIWYTGSTWSLF